MIYTEAIARLAAEGLRVEPRPFGIRGWTDGLCFDVGRSSGGGDELSIRREPDGPVRWFQRASLEELTALVVAAIERVRAGKAPSLLDALLALDGR